MLQNKSSFLAALALSAMSATSVPQLALRAAPTVGRAAPAWRSFTKRKPWGGSVKRHARAMAAARRSKGGRA